MDLVRANPALREVELADAKRYAAALGADVIEASALTGENINEIFEQATGHTATHTRLQ